MEKLYTTQETAKILGVKKSTLDGWCSRGEITYHKVGGRRFTKEDIDVFLEARKKEAV